MSDLRYDVEADWYLLDTCNYRCDYCFFSDATLGKKLTAHAEPRTWKQAFDATGLTWLLHLTGGEPTLYPHFIELSAALTERHYLSMNTNMTGAAVSGFAERIDPSRVSFINAGLHFLERERKRGAATFLRNVETLRSRGFPVFVSMVATPEALARAADAFALLEPLGMVPVPKLLRGPHRGRLYPRDYSDMDRRRFRVLSRVAREAHAPWLAAQPERPTIDPFEDDIHLHGTPSYEGRTCAAGQRFVSIGKTGDVHRCSTKSKLGNILDGTLSLAKTARACDTSYCFYFCQKYAEPARPVPALPQAAL
jgi:MoaA/NifB/PqqE/SkfB family radical SAM enzyme